MDPRVDVDVHSNKSRNIWTESVALISRHADLHRCGNNQHGLNYLTFTES